MAQLTTRQLIDLLENVQYAEAEGDDTATEILSEDVPSGEKYIPLRMYLIETSSADNTVSVQKVDDDGNAVDILIDYPLASDEVDVISLQSDFDAVLPTIDEGENIQINANADGVNATLMYVVNSEV